VVDDPQRILIIRPSALGDVCRTVPVAVSLRRRWPRATIDWVVQAEFADAVRAHPAVDGVVEFDRRGMTRGAFFGRAGWQRLNAFRRRLRDANYDLVIDCQGLARSGIFAVMTGSPMRVGYANAEELASWAYTQRVDAPRDWHTVDRMVALVGALGVEPVRDMRLHTSEADRASVPEGLRGKRYAVVAPSSRWAAKRWPGDRFARVAEALLGRGAVDAVAVVASGSEREQCREVLALADARIVDLVGATTVGGLMAVIEGSAIVIANDSAALHMAVGFDRPMVGLFGPTRIDLVGPYGRSRDVIQARVPEAGMTHKDARHAVVMEEIGVDAVIRAALDRLGGEGGGRRGG
jgi:lipopolysaccharide heptosyltransferase I